MAGFSVCLLLAPAVVAATGSTWTADLRHFARYGGAAADHVLDVGVTAQGTVWVLSATKSSVLRVCEGAVQGQIASTSSYDAYLQHWDVARGALLYCTYLGGASDDADPPEVTVTTRNVGTGYPRRGLALDADGSVVAVFPTSSQDFPTTAGAYQRIHRGNTDVAIVKLSSDGRLLWSTLLGGTNFDSPIGVALAPGGEVLVWGSTRSDGLGTSGVYQRLNSGGWDGFLAGLSPDGSSLLFFTYLGGPGFEIVTDAKLSTAGSIVVVGQTSSNGFPNIGSARHGPGGGRDVFVARLGAAGASLQSSALIGGTGFDAAHGLLELEDSTLVVLGATHSADFPRTRSVGSPAPASTHLDGFWFHLSPDFLNSHQTITFGTSADDLAVAAAILDRDHIVISGRLGMPLGSFPVSPGAPWPLGRGGPDALVSIWDVRGGGLEWSTLVSGDAAEWVTCLDVTRDYRLVAGGTTLSSPATLGTLPPLVGQWEIPAGRLEDAILLDFSLKNLIEEGVKLFSALPRRIANARSVTVRVAGARLDNVHRWRLVDRAGAIWEAERLDASEATATLRFDLVGAALGNANLVAISSEAVVAEGTDFFEIITEDCTGPRVRLSARPIMRAGDRRRPNVLRVTFTNPCAQDVIPLNPFTLEFTPPDIEVVPRTPTFNPPGPWGPADPFAPISLSDGKVAVSSVIPPPLAAGESKDWVVELHVPERPGPRDREECERQPDHMTVRSSFFRRHKECFERIVDLAAVQATGAVAGIFGGCSKAMAEALVVGSQYIQASRDPKLTLSDDAWNALGFFYSAAKGVAVCSPFVRVAAAIKFALASGFADQAGRWMDWATLFSECGVPIANDLYSTVRYSCDPNAVIGPVGGGSRRATAQTQDLIYAVLFENAPTASAEATEVILEMHLDPTRFLLESLRPLDLSFGSAHVDLRGIGLGDTAIAAVPGRDDLVLLAVLRMDLPNSVLRAELLARMAHDLSVPPFEGFLPPNDDSGRGEGALRFVLDLLPNTRSDTEVAMQAAITFDTNAPLTTNVWRNLIDLDPPRVDLMPEIEDATGWMRVQWDAADSVSGVASALLVGFLDDGSRVLLSDNIHDGKYLVRGTEGRLRGVAVASVDSAGNWRGVDDEDFVMLPDPPSPLRLYAAVPNPTRHSLSLELGTSADGHAEVDVYDVTGRRIAGLHSGAVKRGYTRLFWNLADSRGVRVGAGVYFVRARMHDQSRVVRAVVLPF